MTDETIQRAALLIVDDDEGLLRAASRLLRPAGVKVFTATSGPQALALLEQEARGIGAVLSDYAMPGMTGADFLREVRLRWPDLTRAMVTGNADLAAAARAVNEGQLSRLITKPWNPEAFVEAVGEALEQHRMLLENRRLRELADQQAAELAEWNRTLEQQVADRTAELEKANATLQRGLLETVRLMLSFLELRLPQRAAERLVADASRCDPDRLRGALAVLADLELDSRGGAVLLADRSSLASLDEDTIALRAIAEITA